MSRFEIHRSLYRKAIPELRGYYTEEQYQVYKIYDTKKEEWISIDDFAEIAKEKEKKWKWEQTE